MLPGTQDTGVDGGVSSAGAEGISYLSTVIGGEKPGRISMCCTWDGSRKHGRESCTGSAARCLLGEPGTHQVVENEDV